MSWRLWLLLILIATLYAIAVWHRLESDRNNTHSWPDSGPVMPPP